MNTSAPQTPPIATADHWISLPQGRLFARSWTPADTDTRTPIVLFHDSLGCVGLWRDFPAELCAATGRRVIAYDRLGFGLSDARADRPSLDFVAEESRDYFPALRAQLGLDRFIACGHSVGGAMAVHCAADYGADCEALITIAAQVFPEDRTLAGIRAAKEQFQDPKQMDRLRRYHGDKAEWVLEAWTESWLRPEFADWTLEPVLPHVRCPVLALHGVHDEYGTAVHPETIARLSSGRARVEIIPETYHVPHRERPELVAGLVQEFLASVG